MADLLRMPEIAANTAEAVLSSWELSENATFAADDVLATVETAKAVVDVAAEADGVILKHLVAAGTEVESGAAIAVIGAPGEVVDDIETLLATLGLAPADVAAAPVVAAESPAEKPVTLPVQDPAAAPDEPSGRNGRVFSSPLARRMARDAGVPVGSITGTGPGGRIVRRDVEQAIAAAGTAGVRPADAPPPAAAAAAPVGEVTDVPHTRMRRLVAARLTESKTTAPHFYLRGSVRVDRLLAMRAEINDGAPVRVSVNDLVVKAVAQTHLLVPAMNVIWTPDAVRRFSSVDVSVAVATDNGLVTPVLRAVEGMSVTGVATAVQDFAARAKAGRLQERELSGGSITVTNLGMFGTEEFAAIINPPQSAILAVGAATQQPVVVDGVLEVGTVMQVTLSVDHRPVDGVVAAEWMRVFRALVEHPARILA